LVMAHVCLTKAWKRRVKARAATTPHMQPHGKPYAE
jgi:hypothetical protein